MVLYTLINVSLDVSANISWWIAKNTLYGTYYIASYFLMSPPKPTKEEIELLELRKEISHLNRKLYFIDNINNNPLIVDKNKLTFPTSELNTDKDFVFIDDSEL